MPLAGPLLAALPGGDSDFWPFLTVDRNRGALRRYFNECRPIMLPSVSSTSAMKPYWPIENLPR